MEKEDSELLRGENMMKRTERLIDAVKLIDLLEILENREAMLKVERIQEEWKMECIVDGNLVTKSSSDSISEMINSTLVNIRKIESKNHIQVGEE